MLHKPTTAFLSPRSQRPVPELNYTDAQLSAVLRRDATNPAVSLASDDLYWIDQAGDWNHTETLSTNIASRYYRKQFNLGTYSTIQVENMPIHTSGGASSGGWLLWANGYVAQEHQRHSGRHLPLQCICQRHSRAGRLADHDAQD